MEPSKPNSPSRRRQTADRVEIEYQLTGEDCAAWRIYAWEKAISRASRSLGSCFVRAAVYLASTVIVLLLAFTVFVGLKEISDPASRNKDHLPMLTGVPIFLLFLFALLRGIGPRSLSRSMARREVVRRIQLETKRIPAQNQKVVLTPERVIEIIQEVPDELDPDKHCKAETILEWTNIDTIELAAKHVFFLSENDLVLIIPQRAFAEQLAFLDFVVTAWTFHRRARENSAPRETANSDVKLHENRITKRFDEGIMP